MMAQKVKEEKPLSESDNYTFVSAETLQNVFPVVREIPDQKEGFSGLEFSDTSDKAPRRSGR